MPSPTSLVSSPHCGKDITNAQALYWQDQNAGDKVCGKYDVKLEVKDHGYVTQQGVSALQLHP